MSFYVRIIFKLGYNHFIIQILIFFVKIVKVKERKQKDQTEI